MLKVDQNTNLSINIKLKEQQYHRSENFPQKQARYFTYFDIAYLDVSPM